MKIKWRTSTRSTNQGNCVQVAPLSNQVLVQDSKDPGPRLAVTATDWSALVAAIKDGWLG